MSIVRHLPNLITCCNLLCGCLSVVVALDGRLTTACYFIFFAAVFDFFDGFTARLLKAYSDIGKELDSLADMVSFGVAPASIMYGLLQAATAFPNEMCAGSSYLSLPAFIIAVFSALRLAKFNIDKRQTESFIGLPTPANALFICALAFIAQGHGTLAALVANRYFLWAVIVVFSYLLIAELPLFSLKFKSYQWKSNKVRYIFLAISLALLVIFHWAGLALVIILYIILSVFDRIGFTNKQTHG